MKYEPMDNSGILGQLMDLSQKAIISLQNWVGELMKNKFLTMQFFTYRDVKLQFISPNQA